jgi:hypothetical protein
MKDLIGEHSYHGLCQEDMEKRGSNYKHAKLICAARFNCSWIGLSSEREKCNDLIERAK